MTWEKALLKSIEKWDAICFEGAYTMPCTLCSRAGRPKTCGSCPLFLVGQECENLNQSDLWSQTSENLCKNPGCDTDIHMYLFLCMLYHEYYG
jgi:hypothetical protein